MDQYFENFKNYQELSSVINFAHVCEKILSWITFATD